MASSAPFSIGSSRSALNARDNDQVLLGNQLIDDAVASYPPSPRKPLALQRGNIAFIWVLLHGEKRRFDAAAAQPARLPRAVLLRAW